jgi:hypothetical protein
MIHTNFACRAAALVLAALGTASVASAQFAERGDLPGSGSKAVDVSGRSVKNKRVRAVHTTDPNLQGGTAYLIRKDPFLAYQLGRNLNFREFRERDGVFSSLIANFGGLNPDFQSAKITANNNTGCASCHNLPNGNPGGGANFSKDSGFGRNSPHYYGAGIMEMLALQVRADILRQADTDGSGWISVAESQAAPDPIRVEAEVGGVSVDYGSLRLTGGATGTPQLNRIFRVWYVDANGVEVPWAFEVDGVNTVGFNFELVVWGWGQAGSVTALNPTNRAFLWDPWLTHSGLEAHDPSTLDDPDGDGVSVPTLAGAIQFPTSHRAPDRGFQTHANGFSLDDPDQDGHLTEISEGDLDLAEWFMLNAPRPAFRGTAQQYQDGLRGFRQLGCAQCHVPDWDIRAQDQHFDGDRRLFDLETTYDASTGGLRGRLVPLYDLQAGIHTPRRQGFHVVGLFSDLKHHDMGEGFEETDFGGTRNRVWRTAPLWGVGSGFPWGHDGSSLTLEDVILRHGGEAAGSRQRWLSTSEAKRQAVLTLLRGLQLYDIESLPADIDGDGQVSQNFVVAGRDTGVERFNPEWLFLTPGRIQGDIQNTFGETVKSFCIENLDAAYGQLLPYRVDSDDDGWPDVWDVAPSQPGYKDGVNN